MRGQRKQPAVQEYEYWEPLTWRRRFRSFWIGGRPLVRYVGGGDGWYLKQMMKLLYTDAIRAGLYEQSPILTRLLKQPVEGQK